MQEQPKLICFKTMTGSPVRFQIGFVILKTQIRFSIFAVNFNLSDNPVRFCPGTRLIVIGIVGVFVSTGNLISALLKLLGQRVCHIALVSPVVDGGLDSFDNANLLFSFFSSNAPASEEI